MKEAEVDENDENNEADAEDEPKGQLISKCSFGVFKSPKRPTKFL